jgi:hypothetical protein
MYGDFGAPSDRLNFIQQAHTMRRRLRVKKLTYDIQYSVLWLMPVRGLEQFQPPLGLLNHQAQQGRNGCRL